MSISHNDNPEMIYRSAGAIYEAVCELIGWDADMRPVEVCEAGDVVLVRGTALKPHEWRSLIAHDGDALADGRVIRLASIPSQFL